MALLWGLELGIQPAPRYRCMFNLIAMNAIFPFWESYSCSLSVISSPVASLSRVDRCSFIARSLHYVQDSSVQSTVEMLKGMAV